MYKIKFDKKSKKQFYNLNRDIQERITKAIENKLVISPQIHLISLKGERAYLYKFRVGDYRLLCSKNDENRIILVVGVKHRKEVYR